MDALLDALFSQLDGHAESFEKFNPEQILAAQYGPSGGISGTPYGLWGSMYGQYAPDSASLNPLKAFAPQDDPLLTALLRG